MPTLHHAGMTVSDLDRALSFWRDALGMETVVDQESRGGYFEAIVGERDVVVRTHHLAFGGEGARVELFEFVSPAGGRHQSRPADVGFAHVCVAVESGLDELVARLLRAGGSTATPDPVVIDRGANAGGRALYLRDPDGHVLELFEPPAR
ncbi:MAG: lactoylglutathione lyase [Gaiellaceae bacterium]|nr:lactoylglutathione lyase [Gaiellaceae bacterium]